MNALDAPPAPAPTAVAHLDDQPPRFQRGFLRPQYWGVWLALALLRLLALLPQRLRMALGAGLGELFYRLARRQRRTAERNLALCFPRLSERARRALLRQHFRLSGAAALSVGLMWWAPVTRLRRLVHVRGREHYDAALAAGRPIILLAPHFVGLEVGGVYLAHERPIVSMYKRSRDPLFDWFMRRGRLRFGGTLIERDAHLKSLVRLVRSGVPFYYLPDQNPGGASHVFAPFFGVPTATVTALARLARLAEAVVIPCFTRLLPGGRGYEIVFRPPLADFPCGDEATDAARMNAAIEDGVREMPEQYLWTYKRFKDRPAGAAPRYG